MAVGTTRKSWHQANRERLNAYSRARYAAMTEEQREHRRKRQRDYARSRYRANPEFYKLKRRESNARNTENIAERHRDWRYRNRDYVRACRKKVAEQRSLIPAPRKGERWSRSEDLVIVENPNVSIIELCYMLGRTYESVQRRRRKLDICGGLIETFVVPDGWLTTRQIAARLGCSYTHAVTLGRKFGERKAPRNGWLVREEVICSYPYRKYRKRLK